ncbi:hypothetical protein ACFRR6_01855 [Streptomyces sp. NPDC056891]|uniref:hypothetical protein n=1 Tax=Streptomyces sp. NPDC056891 TaxID=3345961 RepID=UPI0036B8F5F6
MAKAIARTPTLPGPTKAARASAAERMRSQLADFWGKPILGLPHGMDLLWTMYITVTANDPTPDAVAFYRALCQKNAAAYRSSDVWVAPDSMSTRITEHPFLTNASVVIGNLEDAAPARDGLVYFPNPIQLFDLHPIHGIAWHMDGTGDDLELDIETITATSLIPSRLPPMLAATTKLTSTPFCPNGLAHLADRVLAGSSNFELFGAPGPSTTLALLLAFWELRRPTTPLDTPDDQSTSAAPDEDLLTVPQYRASGNKSKRKQRPRKREIRIIQEPRHNSASTDVEPDSTGTGPKWREDTLRWEVSAQWQNRCPNPHQHRAIVEAGGVCNPVRVRVKDHTNGPKGRSVDPRRAVRIVPERP